jgi:hypothetical protein
MKKERGKRGKVEGKGKGRRSAHNIKGKTEYSHNKRLAGILFSERKDRQGGRQALAAGGERGNGMNLATRFDRSFTCCTPPTIRPASISLARAASRFTQLNMMVFILFDPARKLASNVVVLPWIWEESSEGVRGEKKEFT